MDDAQITEKWTIVDEWWTPDPKRADYREVIWKGNWYIISRVHPENVWRIVSVNGSAAPPGGGST